MLLIPRLVLRITTLGRLGDSVVVLAVEVVLAWVVLAIEVVNEYQLLRQPLNI